MPKRQAPRILHLPESVGGNAYALSNAMKRAGLDSTCWIVKPNYLNYGFDFCISKPNDGYLMTELKRLMALRYVFRFDVVLFNFGSTLFRPLALRRRPEWSWGFYLSVRVYMVYARLMQRVELALLRLLRRRMFVIYQGDDARQGDYCLAHYEISPATEVDEYYYHADSDEHKRQQIKLFDRHCDGIYALNPDLLNVLPERSRFLPYSHIDLNAWTMQAPVLTSKRSLRIGHAPTHRGVKGTKYFLAALEQLQREGYDIELILIEGMSQSEAKIVYKTLDVVLDQLFVGWYGGLAVEAMALGKPVMAYIRPEDMQHLPAQMHDDLPVLHTTASSLLADLRALVVMPRDDLGRLGQKSRAYVERWHDPETVARHLISDMFPN